MLTFLGGILGNFLSGLWSALFGWIGAQEKTAEDVSLGQDQQKVVDQTQMITTVKAEAQAEASAPTTVAGVETRLNDGTF